MTKRLTRREVLKQSAIVSAVVAFPFIHYRYADAGEIDPAVVRKFGASLKGRLMLPGDRGYAAASQGWHIKIEETRDFLCQLFATATNAGPLSASIWRTCSDHGDLRSGVHVRSVGATSPVAFSAAN